MRFYHYHLHFVQALWQTAALSGDDSTTHYIPPISTKHIFKELYIAIPQYEHYFWDMIWTRNLSRSNDLDKTWIEAYMDLQPPDKSETFHIWTSLHNYQAF